MNSFNHYAYGAIGDWMYRVSAGIETKDPGYKDLLIQPHPSKKLGYSRASFESVYGKVASGWERKDGKIIVSVEIPANTRATIVLPVSGESAVTENGKAIRENENFSDIRVSAGSIILETGSGRYRFELPDKL